MKRKITIIFLFVGALLFGAFWMSQGSQPQTADAGVVYRPPT